MHPTPEPREVWITGMGLVTAFGEGVERLRDALAEGRSAAGPPWAFDPAALPLKVMAELRRELPEVPGFPDDRKVSLLFLAASEAVERASLSPGLGPRAGVFLGTGLSSVSPRELEEDLYPHLVDHAFDRGALSRDLAPDRVAPRRHHPSRATRALALAYQAAGPLHTSFSACAAGARAIGSALMAVRRGEIDVALAGGHDSMTHPLGMLSFLVLGTLCEERCRPFDLHRNGFLLGEGAAVIVVEAAERARARGARPLARLLGVGTSLDAHAVTAPHPEGHGAWLAMRRALEDAGVGPEAVDYVNAHGTGTQVGDQAEACAIRRLFPDGIPVCSLKGSVGHTIAAAGPVELVGSIVTMLAGFMPPTVGCLDPDPACPIDVIQEPRWRTPRLILSNSFGFGGQNAAILVGHPDA
jgi:3-oxoacyl-[acyl-carrier-protein] synthase II